jgi:nucleotide-binding universal stress UspA family protein
MESKRAFSYQVLATNPEATTERETQEFGLMKDSVIEDIMLRVEAEEEAKVMAQYKGRELSPEERQQVEQKIMAQKKAMTPDGVRKFMARDYQDPAEVLGNQLLNYLKRKLDVQHLFNEGMLDAALYAREVYFVGIVAGEPLVRRVQPWMLNYDKVQGQEFIENGENCTCEYRMSPSEVIKYFGKEMTPAEIDEVYENHQNHGDEILQNNLFEFENRSDMIDSGNVRVLHACWVALRAVKFLLSQDPETGEEVETIVDESYKLQTRLGDISLTTEWIPEVNEGWKIGANIYKQMRPIPGQLKDIDTMYQTKLPYFGAIYNEDTSIMDRLKVYQYYYNIIMYRMELLLASDKGKKVLMNINAIPSSAGIDMKKWKYFFESSPFMWYDPNEEGAGIDASNIAKEINLSLISDINKYVELAEYIRVQAGKSVGITDQVEGDIGAYEGKANVQQGLIQSSHILEPYFQLHAMVKKNVLSGLLEAAKVAYAQSKPRKLVYILDDLSKEIIDLDPALLDNSTLGLFVENSAKAQEAKQLIESLAHAAMQAQKVELSDIAALVRTEGVTEAEEILKAAEEKSHEKLMEVENQKHKNNLESQEMLEQAEEKRRKHEADMIVLKESERRETEIAKAALLGQSFNPDADADNDGVNDFFEIAKHGLDADIRRSDIQLKRDKLEHDKVMDAKKIDIEEKKIKAANKK